MFLEEKIIFQDIKNISLIKKPQNINYIDLKIQDIKDTGLINLPQSIKKRDTELA